MDIRACMIRLHPATIFRNERSSRQQRPVACEFLVEALGTADKPGPPLKDPSPCKKFILSLSSKSKLGL